MSAKTGIEWTQRTWNPTTGCDKVSAGCKHCYAEKLALRLKAMGNRRYSHGFALTLHGDKVREPLSWREPQVVFVNSMSDLLHRDVPLDFIAACVDAMVEADWHTYQILTKRPERWAEVTATVIGRHDRWPRHVLPGTSIENRRALDRLPHLALAGEADTVRMISVEPLLESLLYREAHPDRDDAVLALAGQLAAARIGWVITGGEAGWDARPAEVEWFREVRDACTVAEIPFFHKQHGGVGTTKLAKRGGTLALLDGQMHHEMPAVQTGQPPAARGSRSAQLALV